jgi:DNA-binding PadR family transcriptional regulator
VEKALDDLEEEGLVTEDGDGYELTDEGEAYEADRKKRERNT